MAAPASLLLYNAVLAVFSDFLGCPIGLGLFIKIFTPLVTAYGCGVEETVLGIALTVVTSPVTFWNRLLSIAPAGTSRLVSTAC